MPLSAPRLKMQISEFNNIVLFTPLVILDALFFGHMIAWYAVDASSQV